MSDSPLERRIAQLEHVVRAGFRDARREFAEANTRSDALRDELRRHMDVVAERLETRFNVVADGLISLRDHGATADEPSVNPQGRIESLEVRVAETERVR